MKIETAANAVLAAMTVSMIGMIAYSAKKESELNQIMEEGIAQMKADRMSGRFTLRSPLQ